MEQRTDSWTSWRRRGLGASDAPIILGVSPWKTPYQLWLEKTGRAEPAKGNWATERGNEMEPRARARYELIHLRDMPPVTMEHPEFPFIRASLDGLSTDGKIVLEIKCPGEKDHQTAKAGQVPEKYIWQLEHQLFVTGAEEAHYFSYYEKKVDGFVTTRDHALVVYHSVPERRKKLLKELFAFWDYIQKNEPPPIAEKDALIVTDPNLQSLVRKLGDAKVAYKEAQELAEKLELEYCELKSEVAKRMTHPKIRYADVEVTKVISKFKDGRESITHRVDILNSPRGHSTEGGSNGK